MEKKLEIRRESRDAVTRVYSLFGSLYGSQEGYDFQNEVRREIAAGARKVVVDMAGVERIDSSGIGILVAAMWSASHGGAGLILASLSPKVEKVLAIALLLDHIGHAESVELALARLDAMPL
jgi:anti-sigma B factor antagonist